jgi:hypothetical protein
MNNNAWMKCLIINYNVTVKLYRHPLSPHIFFQWVETNACGWGGGKERAANGTISKS